MKDLNRLYRSQPALYAKAFEQDGFEWIDYGDNNNSTLIYLRKSNQEKETLLVLCNFTPNTLKDYRIGVPPSTRLNLILNTDEKKYWGSGYDVSQSMEVEKKKSHGREHSVVAALVPLGVLVYSLQ